MEGLIFVLLIAVILGAAYRRKRKKRQAKVKQIQLPGRTPATAEMIHHSRQIDTFVRQQRCHCGGKVYVCAQSNIQNHGVTAMSHHKKMHVAVCECMRCEEVHRFYFEIEYLN